MDTLREFSGIELFFGITGGLQCPGVDKGHLFIDNNNNAFRGVFDKQTVTLLAFFSALQSVFLPLF